MSNFNVQQTHPIIPRQQTYVLFQKIISFHSYDRDIKKWPNSNFFEIDLPQSLINLQSMRLVQITLPNNQYVFTNAYQNTKLQFQVTMSVRAWVLAHLLLKFLRAHTQYRAARARNNK